MTPQDISLAFFDSTRGVYGTIRDGLATLFDHESIAAVSEEVAISAGTEGGYEATCAEHFELLFLPASEAVDLERASVRVCHVKGTVGGRQIDCLGSASEIVQPPDWSQLAAVRTISAIADQDNAAFCLAERPRGALGHGDELVTAGIVSNGSRFQTNDARISTVYDSDGRQRSASAEIWIDGEDFPRRLSGAALARTSVQLDDLRVNAAIFLWRLQGSSAPGAYEIVISEGQPSAA